MTKATMHKLSKLCMVKKKTKTFGLISVGSIVVHFPHLTTTSISCSFPLFCHHSLPTRLCVHHHHEPPVPTIPTITNNTVIPFQLSPTAVAVFLFSLFCSSYFQISTYLKINTLQCVCCILEISFYHPLSPFFFFFFRVKIRFPFPFYQQHIGHLYSFQTKIKIRILYYIIPHSLTLFSKFNFSTVLGRTSLN